MTNENVKLTPYDPLLAKTVLRLVPSGIKPNHFTIARVFLTPLVLSLIWLEIWDWAVSLFILTAITDILDGSLARTRKQITLWGTIADPIADKLLITTTVILFVAKEINPIFSLIIVLLELMIVLTGVYRRSRGHVTSANWAGKTKMVLQCIGVIGLLMAKMSGLDMFVPLSMGTFSLAIVFAIISLVSYGI